MTSETIPPAVDEDWIKVGHYPNLQEAYDRGLVILAMGEACRVEESGVPGEYDLQAEPVPLPRISEELTTYEHESTLSVKRPAPPSDWGRHPAGWWCAAVWALVVTAVFLRQGENPSLADWAASSSKGLIDRHEWWRPFTALFLHGDIQHLAGNLAGGTVLAMLVSKVIGPLRAWVLILLCGTLGNALTAWLRHPQSYASLGASTAVFAALGILAGHGLTESFRQRAHLRWSRVIAPVVAGVILLGWLGGSNGGNTDVVAHVFGFGTGLVAGAAVGLQESHAAEA